MQTQVFEDHQALKDKWSVTKFDYCGLSLTLALLLALFTDQLKPNSTLLALHAMQSSSTSGCPAIPFDIRGLAAWTSTYVLVVERVYHMEWPQVHHTGCNTQ